jgi:hypothetical protein
LSGGITFSCACGQSITVGIQFGGKMGRCPRCKQPVQVPASAPAAAAPAPMPANATPSSSIPRPAGPATGRPAAAPPPKPAAPAPAAKARAPKLEVVTGPPTVIGKTFPLQPKPTVIGRDPLADLSIPSERISRRHCQLEPSPDGMFLVSDLGSSNGTLVNQERIAGKKTLLGGEYIQIGDCLFRFLDS